MITISYGGYRFPPEIIQHAIWLYTRFTPSFRDVEDLLAERGVMVSYETVRRWVSHFGTMVAADLRKRRPKPYTTCWGGWSRRHRCAKMRSPQISNKGDRPWNLLAELARIHRNTFFSFMGGTSLSNWFSSGLGESIVERMGDDQKRTQGKDFSVSPLPVGMSSKAAFIVALFLSLYPPDDQISRLRLPLWTATLSECPIKGQRLIVEG